MKKRIYGFTWTNCNGQKVTMYERDFNSHEAFMKERRRFKNQGTKITDLITTTPEKKPAAKKKTSSKAKKK